MPSVKIFGLTEAAVSSGVFYVQAVCLLHISHSISIGLTQLQLLAWLSLRANKGFYLVPDVRDETEIQRRLSQW